MDLKILDFLEKGTKTIARVEANNGTDKVIVPVDLDSTMDEGQFFQTAKDKADEKFLHLNDPVLVPKTQAEVMAEIEVIKAQFQALRDDLEAKKDQIINK